MVAVKSTEELIRVFAGACQARTIAGTCREHRADGPVVVQAVWVAWPLMRVEEPPGTLDTVLGKRSTWHRWPESGRVSVEPRGEDTSNPYTHPAILRTYPHDFWADLIGRNADSVTATARDTEMHGRPAIEAVLPGKAGDFRLTVDAATGTWLEAMKGAHPWLEWDHVDIDIEIDSRMFDVAPA